MTAPQGERISKLEQRIADHESRCEERLGEIKATASATQKAVDGLKNRFVLIALSLLAWAFAQVFATLQSRPADAPSQTVNVRALGR